MAGSLQPVLGLLTQALTPTKAVGAGEGEGGVTPSVGLVSDLSRNWRLVSQVLSISLFCDSM